MSGICFLFVILQALALVSQSYQQCDEIDPPENGEIFFDGSYRYYQVRCDNGYILHGAPVVHCKRNSWSNERPTCTKIAVCEALADPENGRVECDEGPLTQGKACDFTCFDGYELKGVKTRRCLHYNQWSGPSTKCIPVASTFCSLPPPLRHGTVMDCTSFNMPRHSQKCTFRCNKGYRLHGPTYLTCRFNGKLTDEEGKETFPECIAVGTLLYQEEKHERQHEKTPVSPKWDNSVPSSYEQRPSREPEYNPCENLGGCKHICKNEGGRARCRCRDGFALADDQKSCIEISHSESAHDSNRPYQITNKQSTRNVYSGTRQPSTKDACGNQCDQLCVVENDGPRCRCNVGYKINDDNRTCRVNKPCRINNGGCSHYCTTLPYSIQVLCTCPYGYRIGSDGKTCIANSVLQPAPIPQPTPPAETCHKNNGGCEHICKMTSWSYVQCSCQRGFKLHTDGKHCVDTDECLGENPCQHYCSNTVGSYSCYCKSGYILTDGYKCEGCKKNSYWSSELNNCIDCPRNSHTDSEGKISISDCTCDAGYIRNPGEYLTCEDIDECRVNNFGCSDRCTNIPGNAYCTCPGGFMLDSDNKTCIDIDECSIKNGGCEGLCHNTEGSFYCSCPEGFTSSKKDHYSCDDIDECLENNGGCEQKCINYRGGYYCACDSGYLLDSEMKKCTDIQCPILPLPHYSNMECKKRGEDLPEMDSYPAGTTCTFHCSRGFKNIEDSNKMKCQKDGTWKGTLPECKPQNCPHLEVPENGNVYPPTCAKQGAEVKQKCTFFCGPGFKLEGNQIFVCKNNLTWNHQDIPFCSPDELQPTITCPRDIQITLLTGKATHTVIVPKPATNMENYLVYPSWVSTETPIQFPAGETKVTFTAYSLTSNSTSQCDISVTVLDEEPPVFKFCPDSMKIEGAGADGESVTWEEPVVSDNVEIVSVFSILEPNTTLTPGTHFVEYIARDSSGNTATCSFDITITRMNCSDLMNSVHGEANCMDWMFGKLCKPECDDGYMRDPDEPIYYSCDDSGVWEPGETISECLEFLPATASTCQDGFELKTNDETGENVCVKCSSSTVWSATTRKCE